jgi:hypothetical protein
LSDPASQTIINATDFGHGDERFEKITADEHIANRNRKNFTIQEIG